MKKGEMLSQAILMATTAHHGQFDKGGNPYALHPLRVMFYTKSDDEEVQCIALLHDVIEDTNITYDDFRTIGMSERVITAVKCLTKIDGQTYEQYKEAIFSNRDAMRVKLADLRHNSDIRRLKGIKQKDIERLVKYQTLYLQIEEKLGTPKESFLFMHEEE